MSPAHAAQAGGPALLSGRHLYRVVYCKYIPLLEEGTATLQHELKTQDLFRCNHVLGARCGYVCVTLEGWCWFIAKFTHHIQHNSEVAATTNKTKSQGLVSCDTVNMSLVGHVYAHFLQAGESVFVSCIF